MDSVTPCALLLVLVLANATAGVSVTGTVSNSAAPDSTAYNSQRKLVSDSKGSIYIAYVRQVDALNQVYVAESKNGGLSWSDVARVSLTSSEASRVSMAIDSRDNLHVVWTQGVGESRQIFYSARIGEKWTEPIQVSTGKGYSGYPSIAVDSYDNLDVVWYGFDGEFYQIFYASFSDGKWSMPTQISTGTPDSVNPSIAVDASDRLHVVWYKRIRLYYQIFYRSFDQSWREPVVISTGATDSLNAALAIDSKGVVHVVWDKLVEGVSQIFYSKLEGGVWSGQRQLSSGSSDAENPTIGFGQNDTLYVVWQSSEGGIYLRAFDKDWNPQERLAPEGRQMFPSARWSFFNDPKTPVGLDIVWTEVASESRAVRFGRIGGQRVSPDFSDLLIPITVAGVLLATVILIMLWRRRLASQPRTSEQPVVV